MLKLGLLTAVTALLVSVCLAQPFHGPQWDALTVGAKLSKLRTALLMNQTSGPWPSPLETAELLIQNMDLTFDTAWDEFMPNQIRIFPYYTGGTRTKLVHPRGVYMDVFWKSTGTHNYTGIFADGAVGIARLSLAGQPSIDPKNPKLGPGIGIKFPRNFMPSTNIFAIYCLSGQSGLNFFAHDLTNHVPYPGTNASFIIKQGLNSFGTASAWPTMLGVSDMASFGQNGQPTKSVNFPFRLIFHPTLYYHKLFANYKPANSDAILSDVAKSLRTNTTLYEIYAQASPYDTTPPQHIADLQIMNPGSLSLFGDVTMFMQHVRMERDLSLRPQWEAGAQSIVNYQASQDQYYFPDLPWN